MIDILGPAQLAEKIGFASDASGSKKSGGYGCVLNTQWMHGKWDPTFLKECEPSIEYLELFALVASILTWEKELQNCQIIISCDNTAVVQMINCMTSSCKNCMYLIRMLALNNLQFNRQVYVNYLNTKSNFLADALSRGQISHFKKLAPTNVCDKLTQICQDMWPISKVWLC